MSRLLALQEHGVPLATRLPTPATAAPTCRRRPSRGHSLVTGPKGMLTDVHLAVCRLNGVTAGRAGAYLDLHRCAVEL